jgi:hypothetical protein
MQQRFFSWLLLLSLLASCQSLTYTPRSKKNIQKEKPSIVLLDNIIAYRQTYNTWPFSKEEFTAKDPAFKRSFEGFPYLTARFKVADNDAMTFFFSDHIKDVRNSDRSGKVDLNSYGGEVRFFKERDKFIWKLKMY